MNDLQSFDNLVFIDNDKPVTTSEIVAVYFDKKHHHVMRDIRAISDQVGEDFAKSNFGFCYKISHLQNNKRIGYYKISRDGLMLLAMGYNGSKAMQMKLAYINAFNNMHDALLKRHNSLQAQYNKAWLEYELASSKASDAGRALNILGKQIKPACKQQIDNIFDQMQPALKFDAVA